MFELTANENFMFSKKLCLMKPYNKNSVVKSYETQEVIILRFLYTGHQHGWASIMMPLEVSFFILFTYKGHPTPTPKSSRSRSLLPISAPVEEAIRSLRQRFPHFILSEMGKHTPSKLPY